MVGTNGSIDFLCYPKHDSPSIFLRLLDVECGGYFRVHPVRGQHWSSVAKLKLDGSDKVSDRFTSR